MVNYCCIKGCSRNSRIHKHLNFYSLPKDKNRQKQWLKLACRDDLLNKDMDKLRKTLRFCSRHFEPNTIVNRHLSLDALPIKSLPGSLDEDEPDIEPEKHEGIICDSCQDPVLGFRYKCVTCDNYDLCQKCEMLERHPQHYMLRIPKSIRFQIADDLVNKCRNLFQTEDVMANDLSSDDEPVTKYIRTYDSGIDLTEDVKQDIRNEVKRVLEVTNNTKEDNPVLKRKEETVDVVPKKKVKEDIIEISPVIQNQTENSRKIPELVFADVNELKYDQSDVKPDGFISSDVSTPVEENSTNIVPTQPMLYVTLSNDLSQLMIELAQNENVSDNCIMK